LSRLSKFEGCQPAKDTLRLSVCAFGDSSHPHQTGPRASEWGWVWFRQSCVPLRGYHRAWAAAGGSIAL